MQSQAIVDELESALEKGFSDEALARAREAAGEIAYDLVSDLDHSIKEDLTYNLSRYVQRMSEEVIRAILDGDDDRMRRRLSCHEDYYTGRDNKHEVIHGKLFEPDCIELRRKIVEAHSDLLKSERILDLESQVASLVQQILKLEARNEEYINDHRLNQAQV